MNRTMLDVAWHGQATVGPGTERAGAAPRAIAGVLRRLHSRTVTEPLPREFEALLERLERVERGG